MMKKFITNLIVPFLKIIGCSWIAILGATLVTTAVLADVILILSEVLLFESHPYIGILTYLFFPGIMICGLLLIPLGVWLKFRKFGKVFSFETLNRIRVSGAVSQPLHVFQTVSLLTLINLVLFALIGYRGFHYTESREFCGLVCHQVMLPEWTTYQRSPHSEVQCVQCHIGPGAGWFVKSKLSGARQVFAVLFDTYHKPIATPVHNLRPAREVCEVCHRPEFFHGNLIKVLTNYANDEANSKSYTVLNMRVGGGGEHGREASGIHWHVSRDSRIRYYAADEKRNDIVWVEMTKTDGTREVWTSGEGEIDEARLDPRRIRTMDCIDCHNRPTHIYLSLDDALDEWLALGKIDSGIPWIRKMAGEVLAPDYPDRETARAAIARLPALYQEKHPAVWQSHQQQIETAIPAIQEIYSKFVFPQMNIKWDTYPALIGHDSPASDRCFRCHDGSFKTPAGAELNSDCESCHFVLAIEDPDPDILKTLESR